MNVVIGANMSMLKKFVMLKCAGFALPLLFMNVGCGYASTDYDDVADVPESEATDEAEQPIGNTYDVGIIPATTSCPSGGSLREIYMDDEDDHNASRVVGWVGATLKGTRFRFCRVDGSKLFPLASASPVNTNAYYAVIKMGPQCPNGSFEFARYFDNEDDDNNNWTSGDIEPSSQSSSGTHLIFCLFKYGTAGGATMTVFPNFGISYGVFADYNTTFPLAVQKGYVYTDDEDHHNNNSYFANADWINDAQRIVSGDRNTSLEIAKVRVAERQRP